MEMLEDGKKISSFRTKVNICGVRNVSHGCLMFHLTFWMNIPKRVFFYS